MKLDSEMILLVLTITFSSFLILMTSPIFALDSASKPHISGKSVSNIDSISNSIRSSDKGKLGPKFVLEPDNGPPGTVININGKGLAPKTAVDLWDPFTGKHTKSSSDKLGSFQMKISVPQTMRHGTYRIVIDGVPYSKSNVSGRGIPFDEYFTVTRISNTANVETDSSQLSSITKPKSTNTIMSNQTGGAKCDNGTILVKGKCVKVPS